MWNNKEWIGGGTIPASATGSQLHDISCYSAVHCKAVGWLASNATPTASAYTLTP